MTPHLPQILPHASPYPFASQGFNFGGYPGAMPFGGMGGMYQGMYPGGDQLWTGVLGQTAESLGKLNNLLSMTGMLVEHVSNHAKLLFVKAQELYLFSLSCKNYIEKNKAEISAQLGIELDPSPYRSLEERQALLRLRRIRAAGALALTLAAGLLLRRLRRRPKFEAAYLQAISR